MCKKYFLGFFYSKNVECSVFGTLVVSWVSLFTLLNEVFPVDVLKANNVLKLAFLKKSWIEYRYHNKNTSFSKDSLNLPRGFYIRWVLMYKREELGLRAK